MGDVFKEQLVKKEVDFKGLLIKSGIIAGAILVILILYMFSNITIINLLLPFLIMGVIAGAYYLFTMQNVEYEYIYTNGDLDIDCIINKSRRKRVFSTNINAIEIMAHIEDKKYENEFRNLEKTLDFSSSKITHNTYIAKLSYNNKMIKLIIEPNETIQEAMLLVLTPRKFHKKTEANK